MYKMLRVVVMSLCLVGGVRGSDERKQDSLLVVSVSGNGALPQQPQILAAVRSAGTQLPTQQDSSSLALQQSSSSAIPSILQNPANNALYSSWSDDPQSKRAMAAFMASNAAKRRNTPPYLREDGLEGADLVNQRVCKQLFTSLCSDYPKQAGAILSYALELQQLTKEKILKKLCKSSDKVQLERDKDIVALTCHQESSSSLSEYAWQPEVARIVLKEMDRVDNVQQEQRLQQLHEEERKDAKDEKEQD